LKNTEVDISDEAAKEGLPPLDKADRGRGLRLPAAEAEDDLAKLEKMGVPIINEAIAAFREVVASPEFLEIERIRSKARHDEAQALRNAKRKRDEHWRGVVAAKDTVIADKAAEVARLNEIINTKKADQS